MRVLSLYTVSLLATWAMDYWAAISLNGKSRASWLANLAIKILEGQEPLELDILRNSTTLPFVMKNQLDLFDIVKSRIPENVSLVTANNKATTHKSGLVFVLLALILIQAGVIVFLLLRLKQADQHNARVLQENEQRFRDMAQLLPQTVYEADLNGNMFFCKSQRFGDL